MRHLLALRLLADCIAAAYVPLLLLTGLVGLLGYVDQHMAQQLGAIAPVEEWPTGARSIYHLLNG